MDAKARKKNRWADHYTRKARKENYPARSVYKLQQIQKRFHVLKKNQRVLDLGCAPGSWLLYAAETTGPGGRVVGVDLKAIGIRLPSHAQMIVGDVFDLAKQPPAALAQPFHVVLSDMAPATTGRKDVDAARSFNLCQAALDTAEYFLTPSGSFVCKIFQGEDFKQFTDAVKARFKTCKIFKPESTRKASKEIYIIGLGNRHRPKPLPPDEAGETWSPI